MTETKSDDAGVLPERNATVSSDDTFRATLNILSDLGEQQNYSADVQRALLNLLNDSVLERNWLESAQRAVLNIVEDFDLQRAAAESARMQREVTMRELALVNVELDRSNDDLRQFAYLASHDLSEPLRAIAGPIAMVARRYRGQLDDEADVLINFAVDGCERMKQLIDGILAFSRVGRVEGARVPVDCNLVMNSVLVALGPAIAESGASIEVRELPTVTGEAVHLGQVLQNLVGNAIKFVPANTRPAVLVAAERTGGSWHFTVTDNGIGIAPEHRDRIFGMFKRLHGREEYTGAGIGLAMAKKIVERHGGQIGVDNAPSGSGTQFWFTLPIQPSTPIEHADDA